MRRMRCCVPPQRFSLIAMCAVTFRFQSCHESPPGGPRHQTSPEPLAQAVSSWLAKVRTDNKSALKRGNVFAASDGDQLQLDAMQRYLDGSETKAPRCGDIPFKLSRSMEHAVLLHVWHRENDYERPPRDRCLQRTSLLCNSGFAGTGKTTLLQHTTVEALWVLERMVEEQVKSGGARKIAVAEDAKDDPADADEAMHLNRPLGFYVTFNSRATPSFDDPKYLDTERD